jgi:beta-glucosidase
VAQARRPGPLNRDKGYDPQFAYGYGLSYAKPGKVGVLSEDPGVASAAVNVDRYFVDGRLPRAVDVGWTSSGRAR